MATGQFLKNNKYIVLFASICVFYVIFDALGADYLAKKNSQKEAELINILQNSKRSPSLLQKIKSAPSAIVSAIEYKTNSFKPDSEITVPIRGDLRVEVIDEHTICIAGSYANFLKSRFDVECSNFLKGIDSAAANLQIWSRNLFYNILGAEIILKYRPYIANAYQDFSKYKFSDGLIFEKGGYWLNPQGQAQFPDANTKADKLTHNAEVAHYAYLKFSSPFEHGKTYTVENPLSETVTFKYLDKNKSSGAIKINQLGYSPDSKRKYAYLGLWLGTLGKLDISKLKDKDFAILESDSLKEVYRGKLRMRMQDELYKARTPFTGEDVLEMDFSDFNAIGKYKIFVDSVGYSRDFEISNNAIGEAFYVHAKGLYHKRCGIAKEKPFTNWTMGKCHMVTYRSDFPPNNLHYNADSKRGDCGFFNEAGKGVDVSHFNFITQRASNEAIDLNGGWHDAADYDRRPYHYDVVNDLLSVYLFRPENFSDSQLNIPESGNGVADILDEAIWGMEIWRKAQNKDGSVGGWIEATSHPVDYNPSTDIQRYYLSAATMESTMQYAAHASMLALALKNANQTELSKKYLDSSLLAYNWASDSKNRFIKQYDYIPAKKTKPIVLTYKEAAEVPCEFDFKASYNLWLLTKKDEYLKRAEKLQKEIEPKFAETSWRVNPFLFSEFLKYSANDKSLSKLRSQYKARMLKYADERLEWLENNYPYRIAWYGANHHYVTHMSWGKSHPLNLAKFFVNAFELTGESKYRDAAFLSNDFHNGANPTGQTMTSGLGKNYPVKFLDLASYTDGIAEYVQGISPYRNTFGIPREDITLAHALIYKPREDRNFNPYPTMIMPDCVSPKDDIDVETFTKNLGKVWPVWRRFANVEAYTVAASEFTVSETIAPAMALTGWLLTKGWLPDEALKNKKPASDLRELEGFAPLP